jgi:hypothetical protein
MMTIDDLYRGVPDGYGHGGVTLHLRKSVRTTDGARVLTVDPAYTQFSWKAKGRFRDTVLSAETTTRNPNMMGNNWVGDVKAQLDSMGTTDRYKALDALRSVLDDYEKSGNSRGLMGSGPAGSHATVVDEPLGSGADPQDVNDANKKFWDKANKFVTRDAPANPTQAAIMQMQRANDAMWKQQTQHQRTPAKEWGKG